MEQDHWILSACAEHNVVRYEICNVKGGVYAYLLHNTRVGIRNKNIRYLHCNALRHRTMPPPFDSILYDSLTPFPSLSTPCLPRDQIFLILLQQGQQTPNDIIKLGILHERVDVVAVTVTVTRGINNRNRIVKMYSPALFYGGINPGTLLRRAGLSKQRDQIRRESFPWGITGYYIELEIRVSATSQGEEKPSSSTFTPRAPAYYTYSNSNMLPSRRPFRIRVTL